MSRVDFSDPSGFSAPSGLSGLSTPSGVSHASDSPLPSSQPGRSPGPGLAHPSARSCPTNLRGLSNRELLARVKELVSRERAVTLEILVHLVEVERRRLHLELGYPSLFEYCLRHLGYSSSAASRRIHTARCIRDYPEVYGLLEKNEVNLSSVSLVASILKKENKDDLLMRIRNRSQKEVEAIVADYRPPVSLRDRSRPVCVAVASPSPGAPGLALSGTSTASSPRVNPTPLALASGSGDGWAPTQTQRASMCDWSRCGSEKTPNSAGGPPRLERKFQVQFLASERFMKKFERAKALFSNKNGKPSYEAVLEAALDEFLKDHDPESRKQRREERKVRAEARTKSEERVAKRTVRSQSARKICGAGWGQVDDPLFRRWVGDLPPTRVPADGGASRHIPASIRDAVFARDKGRCTYAGPDGVRCRATHRLQIDHIVPYARGGTNAAANLRLLCERHNKQEAERVYGADKMKRFRARE